MTNKQIYCQDNAPRFAMPDDVADYVVDCPYSEHPENLPGVAQSMGDYPNPFWAKMADRCPIYTSGNVHREDAFRRGYHYAVQDILDYVAEALPEEHFQPIQDWCDALFSWHYSHHEGRHQAPPAAPQYQERPRGTATGRCGGEENECA